MFIRLAKDETTNNVMNIVLLIILLPTIQSILSIFTGIGKATNTLASETAKTLGIVLTGTSTGTKSQTEIESDLGKALALELYPILHPKWNFAFPISSFFEDVNEDELIRVLNKSTNELNAAYTIFHYANLYGKSLKSDVNASLNSSEYNEIYRWMRKMLDKMTN